jgi:hypothetical protein
MEADFSETGATVGVTVLSVAAVVQPLAVPRITPINATTFENE